MKNVETYKLSVVLDVDGRKSLATVELNDRALRKLDDVAQRAGKSLRSSLADGLREVGANLADIKAGLDIARDVGGFFFGLAKGAAEAGSKFHDLSVQTGLSVETLSGLELQLKQSGADMDALARNVVVMQRNLGEAASGNKELQKAFASLGIRDVRAAMQDTDGTLRTIVKSLGEATSAGERNAEGAKVLGRGFKELSVFIEDTDGDLTGVIERARQAGRTMTDEAAAAADEFGDQLDELSHQAGVVARSFGMELVPVITDGMADTTGALADNADRWREWGREVADVIRGVRALIQSEEGQSFMRSAGWLWDLNMQTNPLLQGAGMLQQAGARARMSDPTDAFRSVARTDAIVALGLLKSAMDAPKPKRDPSDFFGGGRRARGDSELESAKKRFVQTLHDWADTFGVPRSELRELNSQSKVHRGKGHRSGLAVDISPQFMTPAAIEGARAAGFKVLPKFYTGWGKYGYSTGPHYHVEAATKAEQAKNKVFDEQETILGSLARRLAEVELRNRSLTQSSAEQEVASARLSLGLHKLTGPAAELGETLMQQYEAELKASEASRAHAVALEGLKGLVSSTSAEVFGAASAQDTMAAALRKADVALSSYQGKWAMLLATMKDVEPLMQATGLLLPGGAVDIPVLSGPAVVTSPDAPEAPKPDKIKQVWKELTTLGDETHRLQFAFQQLAQALQSQQQVGQKRGFFSKLLGFASPFLSLIPGVGPILSLGARVASSALAGDYLGAAIGAASGFAPGDAFRPVSSTPTLPGVGNTPAVGSPFRNIPGGVPLNPMAPVERRATGGPIRRGRAYILNELRPEPIVFGDDAHVYPSVGDYMGRIRGGGGRERGASYERLAAAVEALEGKITSMPADHVVAVGARGRGAQAAIAGAYQAHAGRDPQALEWLRRQAQQQVAA